MYLLRILLQILPSSILILCATPSWSQNINEEWTDLVKTNISPSSGRIAYDGGEQIFLAGETLFDLSGSSTSNRNIFLAKYDRQGNQAWITQYGDEGKDRLNSIDVDSSGNAYITGNTPQTQFLAKYDSFGNQLWNTSFGTRESEGTFDVAVNSLGEAYVTGTTRGSLFGPLEGVIDSFVAKFDTSGDLLWGRQFGNSAGEQAFAIDLEHLSSFLAPST